MENARELNLEDLGKITGGELDSVITDYLDEAIQRVKVINKTVDECIQDFYRYNKYFNKEQEEYIRARWNDLGPLE